MTADIKRITTPLTDEVVQSLKCGDMVRNDLYRAGCRP